MGFKIKLKTQENLMSPACGIVTYRIILSGICLSVNPSVCPAVTHFSGSPTSKLHLLQATRVPRQSLFYTCTSKTQKSTLNFYAPFEEGGSYYFAHFGRSVSLIMFN